MLKKYQENKSKQNENNEKKEAQREIKKRKETEKERKMLKENKEGKCQKGSLFLNIFYCRNNMCTTVVYEF